MRIWGVTDTGLVRSENQDSYAIDCIEGLQAAVVCDGMGGTSGGQVASAIAVELFCRELRRGIRADMADEELSRAMCDIVSLANVAVRQEAERNPELERMGTTLVGAVCHRDRAVICNIGDSRAYHITREGIEQITRDHSVVENMLERGKITQAEARHHPNRNLITRAIGPDQEAKADTFVQPWKTGEFLLLCTDGLINTVSDQEILFEVIHSGDTEHCLQRLLEVSRANGAPDNVTAVLIENQ